jgi:hypothetical protein
MIAQADVDRSAVRTGGFLSERRISRYGRLKKISCADNRQARAREIYETCGLEPPRGGSFRRIRQLRRFHNPRMQRRLDSRDQEFIALTQLSAELG